MIINEENKAYHWLFFKELQRLNSKLNFLPSILTSILEKLNLDAIYSPLN